MAGVHEVTQDVLNKLGENHPFPAGPRAQAMFDGAHTVLQPVIIGGINGGLVQKFARTMHGSGGPTKVDTEIWKHILCSRIHGDEGAQLTDEISNLAKRMCREDIPFDHISIGLAICHSWYLPNWYPPAQISGFLQRQKRAKTGGLIIYGKMTPFIA